MSKAIMVIGATGAQGSAVVDSLLKSDPKGEEYTILAVTRDASSPAAQRLLARAPETNKKLRLLQGNIDQPQTLFREAREQHGVARVWGVFMALVSRGPGVTAASEAAQGRGVIDAALAAGVGHFVYSSVERGGNEESWHRETEVPHFQAKQAIEEHLAMNTCGGTIMGWTVLRPVAFMENLRPDFATGVFLAALQNHLGDMRPMQWVATADVGVFAAKAFADPDAWCTRAIGLVGDELSVPKVQDLIERVTGREAPRAHWILGSCLTMAVREVRLMLGWFEEVGYWADIDEVRSEHPGMLTMEQWLRSEHSTFAQS